MNLLTEVLRNHCIDTFTTAQYLFHGTNPDLKKTLIADEMKCVGIGMTMFLVWQFGKGRTHYLRYINKGLQGMMFGVLYSPYFLARKVENEQLEEMVKGMEMEGNSVI